MTCARSSLYRAAMVGNHDRFPAGQPTEAEDKVRQERLEEQWQREKRVRNRTPNYWMNALAYSANARFTHWSALNKIHKSWRKEGTMLALPAPVVADLDEVSAPGRPRV